MIWKVGNGRSINIWLDRWTPEVLAGGPGPSGASKVAEFVDQDRGWWNEAIIEWTFDVGSVAIVKQVSLQNVLGKDLVWWCLPPTRIFTVCSAYGMALKLGLEFWSGIIHSFSPTFLLA